MSELEASTSQSLQKDPEIQQALANHGDDDDDDGPDPHHYHHHHHHHHHQQMHQAVQQQSPPHQPLQPHSGRPLQQQQQQRCHNQPQQSQRHKSSNLSVNRSSEVVTTHVHQAKVHELEVHMHTYLFILFVCFCEKKVFCFLSYFRLWKPVILEAPYVWNVFTRLYCVILDIQGLDITSPQILPPIVNYCGKIIH